MIVNACIGWHAHHIRLPPDRVGSRLVIDVKGAHGGLADPGLQAPQTDIGSAAGAFTASAPSADGHGLWLL